MRRKGLRNSNPEKVTLRHIAELAGTTMATVSRALGGKPGISPAFRQSIVELAKQHGYIPNQLARNMVSGSSTFVGFLASDLNNPFYVAVFRILESMCRKEGLSLLIADSERDAALECQHITQFLRMNVRGIVFFPVSDWDSTASTEHLEIVRKRRLPAVALGNVHEPGISTVVTEEWRAATALVSELKRLGHRRFLLVCGAREGNVPARMRRSAITSIVPETMIEVIDSGEPGWETQVLHRVSGVGERPTAVIAVSDHLALHIYRPLLQAGIRVPEDVSVAAFGSNVWAPHIFPSLSLSEPNAEEQAKVAFTILTEKMSRPDTPDQHIVVPQTFHLRDSVAPPDTESNGEISPMVPRQGVVSSIKE